MWQVLLNKLWKSKRRGGHVGVGQSSQNIDLEHMMSPRQMVQKGFALVPWKTDTWEAAVYLLDSLNPKGIQDFRHHWIWRGEMLKAQNRDWSVVMLQK